MPTPEEIAALDAKLIAAVSGPKSVTVDNMTVTGASVSEIIAAREYLVNRTARRRNPFGRPLKIVPPGSV